MFCSSKFLLTETVSFVLLIEAMFPVLESAEMHCRVQFWEILVKTLAGPISTILLHSGLRV